MLTPLVQVPVEKPDACQIRNGIEMFRGKHAHAAQGSEPGRSLAKENTYFWCRHDTHFAICRGDESAARHGCNLLNWGMDLPCFSEKYCRQLAPQDLCHNRQMPGHGSLHSMLSSRVSGPLQDESRKIHLYSYTRPRPPIAHLQTTRTVA